MAGHLGNNGLPFRGAGRGRGTSNFKSNQLWNGGPRLGFNSSGSGPAERRYEDYQPNLEPGAYCDAPPEIRSVPPPPPPPQPYRRPTFDPNHVPGMSRKRKFQQSQPPPPPPKPPKKKRGKKGSSRSDSPLSAIGGVQAKGNQLAQFAQVNQANQIAAGNLPNVDSSSSHTTNGPDHIGSVSTGANSRGSAVPSANHGQQRATSWQQNNRDRTMGGNTALGNGAFQSKATYQNHYDRRPPYHTGQNRSDPRNRNNVPSNVSDQPAPDLTMVSQNNLVPPLPSTTSTNDVTDPVDEPTAQQKQQWKAQVMAGHAKPDHRKGNGTSTIPGHRTSAPAQRHTANSFVTPSSGSNAASGIRPSTAGPVHQNRQPPVYAAQSVPDQRKRKERPSHGSEQRTPGIPAHSSEPSMASLSLTTNDRSGVRQSVSNDRQRSFVQPITSQPSSDQRKRHDSSTTMPAQVATRPQIQSAARLSPPPDLRRATPEEPTAATIPKPLQRVRRIMTPPGSELSLEERMNNDAIEDELEIIPYLLTRSSEDEVAVSSRASTASISSVHASSPIATNSVEMMEDEDENDLAPALDEKQDDGEFEEEPTILSRLPANYARERKRATVVSVDRNKGRTASRGSASSDVTADISLPVTSSSSLVRGDSEQARAEASKGFSTVLSTSSPAQTEAHLLSAMLPDLSIEIDEKQEYIGVGDADMNDGAEHRRELEAGAEFFPPFDWRTIAELSNARYGEAMDVRLIGFWTGIMARIESGGQQIAATEQHLPKASLLGVVLWAPTEGCSVSNSYRMWSKWPGQQSLKYSHRQDPRSRQTIKTTSKPDSTPPVTTPAAAPPEADDFALLTLWYGYRTNAPNETIRQLAQERIDQIMKKIEENSRKALM
ncbi:hypothetical protein QFC20_004200 [Naganishia adeliensis]|uniref:Uncharacterized protein n=1 Tax=Naganishia adeliensis TaxID=92952 RepID=A0ACC2W294_9TREE|nr:hypothetical protein QFC20_004200 [Naganishia adeliensis]